MARELQIGDSGYLKVPERGYRYVEVIGFDGNRLLVTTTSGYEFTIYEDELED